MTYPYIAFLKKHKRRKQNLNYTKQCSHETSVTEGEYTVPAQSLGRV